MTAYLIEAIRCEIVGVYMITGSERISINSFVRIFCRSRALKRCFFPIPKVFWYLLGWFSDRCLPGMGWGMNQCRNIYFGRSYKPNTVFKHRPIPLKDALEDWNSKNR